MMTSFRLDMEDHGAVLVYVVNHLSQAQRISLVTAKVCAGDARFAPIHDNENVLRSLMKGPSPLVEEVGISRFLTEFGKEVARYLIQSGDFEIPILVREPQAA